MADPITRTAAWLAVLIAVPLALVAGLITFVLLGGLPDDSATPAPTTAAPSPSPALDTPVELPARELTEREEIVCRALISQLPAEVGELAQRPVTAGPEQNAAYGEPPVTVACGAPPAEVAPTDQVWSVSGVCWYAEEGPDQTVLTTLDREVSVRVTVPAAYDAAAQPAAALSPPIVETIPSIDDVPSGC